MYEKRFYEPKKYEFINKLRQLLGNAANTTLNAMSYKEYFNKPTVSIDVALHVSQDAVVMVADQFPVSV